MARRTLRFRLLPLLVVLVAASCGGSPAAPAPPPASPSVTVAPATASSGTHVFIIVMENKSFDQAISGAYTASLVRKYGVLTDYHAVSHPSLPNYLALTSGRTWGITDDGYHRLPRDGIGDQLTAARIPWRAYMEGMSTNCRQDGSGYAVKHNPFAYYGGSCPPSVVPLTSLAHDLQSATPRFVWITPNLCHDTHDCPVADGDRWLSTVVPEIQTSPAWAGDGVLFITWDEAEGSDSATNRVPALVVGSRVAAARPAAPADHYGLLATMEDLLGVPRLGQAAQATPIALAAR